MTEPKFFIDDFQGAGELPAHTPEVGCYGVDELQALLDQREAVRAEDRRLTALIVEERHRIVLENRAAASAKRSPRPRPRISAEDIRSAGSRPLPKPCFWTDEAAAELVAMNERGLSHDAIGKLIGRTGQIVAYHIKKYGRRGRRLKWLADNGYTEDSFNAAWPHLSQDVRNSMIAAVWGIDG